MTSPGSGAAGAGRIIGGAFALEISDAADATPPPFTASLLMANATSAFYLILDELPAERVWLPSYLCPALVKAATHAGVPIELYEVDDDLVCEDPDGLDLRVTDAIVVIHYFGFANPMAERLAADGRAGWLIEDSVQALLTEDTGQYGDFALYSPRKFIGVPDGGVLTQKRELISPATVLEPPPARWLRDASAAGLLRHDFDRGNGGGEWYARWRAAGRQGPVGRYRMSDLSRSITLEGTDYLSIATKRRQNYLRLAAALSDIAMFPQLPDGVVPLGFPVRVDDRDAVRERLYEDLVYPPIHWAIGDHVPERFEASRRLAREIMTIPCDQRYDTAEMERTAQIVRDALA